jgi:hypothetical protein
VCGGGGILEGCAEAGAVDVTSTLLLMVAEVSQLCWCCDGGGWVGVLGWGWGACCVVGLGLGLWT